MADLRARLRETLRWRDVPGDDYEFADVTGWWRDPALLAGLGETLAGLFTDRPAPTVVTGPASRGSLVGPLVAVHLGVGFVEVRRNRTRSLPDGGWIRRTTPPGSGAADVEFGFRREMLGPDDRVLGVDDWIETGVQLGAVREMVDELGATWLGAAVVVDDLRDPRMREHLGVRSLLGHGDL